MQIEARYQRNVLADRLAHAGEDFAFAVVIMLGHHGAVQVEIDAIDRPGRGDAVDHVLDDPLEGVLRHMCRRGRPGRDRRHQLPTIGFRRLDKTGKAGIDLAHDLEHLGAARHRRPAAAMHEVVVSCLRRCEGVGLVQEAANGNTGHQVGLDTFLRL